MKVIKGSKTRYQFQKKKKKIAKAFQKMIQLNSKYFYILFVIKQRMKDVQPTEKIKIECLKFNSKQLFFFQNQTFDHIF